MTTYPIRNLDIDELEKLAEFAMEVSNAMTVLDDVIHEMDGMDFNSVNPQQLEDFVTTLVNSSAGLFGEDQQEDMKKIAVRLARLAHGCGGQRDIFQQEWEEAYFNEPEPLPLPTLKIGAEEIHFEDK